MVSRHPSSADRRSVLAGFGTCHLTVHWCENENVRMLYSQVLKNGVVLCQLMNKISPGSVKKFKTSGPAFLLMENISAFQVSENGWLATSERTRMDLERHTLSRLSSACRKR